MSSALALLLLLVPGPSWAAPADEAVAVPGFAVSLGPGRRVTGRLTYDARKAAGGGYIFAAPRAGAEQAAAVRLCRGLIAGAGGLFSPASAAARRHRVAAVVLPAARFSGGALVVDRPIYGATREIGGVRVESVARVEARPLAENEVVSIDPARGLLIVPAAADQEDELALDEALAAFEGLADAQALVQWWRGRADSPRASALAARLAEEISRRVVLGLARGDGAARVLQAVRGNAPKEQSAAVDASVARAVQGALRDGTSRIEDLAASAREAGTPAAADRLAAEAQAAALRLSQLASAAPGRADASRARAAAAAVASAARKRAAELSKKPALSLPEALAVAGARAPRGATLGAEVYAAFARETGLAPLLAELSNDASLDLRRKGERAAALFAAARPSPDGTAAKAASAAAPKSGLVAVIGPAGRTVAPAARALEACVAAWAGAWTGEAIGRRKRAGLGAPEPVLRLEPLSPADASGTAFSRDPASGRADRLVVSAVLGELEGLTSGQAPADEYVLDRSGARELMPALVADKRLRLELDAQGKLSPVVVPAGPSLARALSPEQLKRVARAARAAEGWLGAPAQLSFAFSDGELVALGAVPLEPSRPEPAPGESLLTPAAPTQSLEIKSLK